MRQSCEFYQSDATFLRYRSVDYHDQNGLLRLEPKRHITKSHRAVSGKKPSKKTGKTHQNESTHERDFLTLVEFDDLIEKYVEQPFTIHYSNDG